MKGFVLLILAVVMSIVLYPLGVVYSLITIRFSFKKLGSYWFVMAVGVDQLGNVVMSTMFNDIMITKYGHKFGDEDQTVSMVLGVNKAMGTLSNMGKLVAKILNKIEHNHVEKAIEKCKH
tara:strand:+ start:886 stop:1245 length:360 start_codon:yes stop_codon:yes gene_type:complete